MQRSHVGIHSKLAQQHTTRIVGQPGEREEEQQRRLGHERSQVFSRCMGYRCAVSYPVAASSFCAGALSDSKQHFVACGVLRQWLHKKGSCTLRMPRCGDAYSAKRGSWSRQASEHLLLSVSWKAHFMRAEEGHGFVCTSSVECQKSAEGIAGPALPLLDCGSVVLVVTLSGLPIFLGSAVGRGGLLKLGPRRPCHVHHPQSITWAFNQRLLHGPPQDRRPPRPEAQPARDMHDAEMFTDRESAGAARARTRHWTAGELQRIKACRRA